MLVLVIDGLRPDAVTSDCMPHLSAFAERAWHPARAITVRPSITVAALTSLGTGVGPGTHGVVNSGLSSFPRLSGLRSLPAELNRLEVTTTVITGELPGPARFLVGGLLRMGGVRRLIPVGCGPRRIVESAFEELSDVPGRRCVVAYVNDADVAGHARGWMSEGYLTAANMIDRTLSGLCGFADESDTMVLVLADHGGGGVLPRDHDHPHPLNEAIPLFLAGRTVATFATGQEPASLLDVPPTIVHAFGGEPPENWEGRVLNEAFRTEPPSALLHRYSPPVML